MKASIFTHQGISEIQLKIKNILWVKFEHINRDNSMIMNVVSNFDWIINFTKSMQSREL